MFLSRAILCKSEKPPNTTRSINRADRDRNNDEDEEKDDSSSSSSASSSARTREA